MDPSEAQQALGLCNSSAAIGRVDATCPRGGHPSCIKQRQAHTHNARFRHKLAAGATSHSLRLG